MAAILLEQASFDSGDRTAKAIVGPASVSSVSNDSHSLNVLASLCSTKLAPNQPSNASVPHPRIATSSSHLLKPAQEQQCPSSWCPALSPTPPSNYPLSCMLLSCKVRAIGLLCQSGCALLIRRGFPVSRSPWTHWHMPLG